MRRPKSRSPVPDAVIQLTTAVQLKPDFAEAQNNLGNALAAEGRLSEAIDHFSDAVQIKPDFTEAQLGLGIDQFLRALDVEPNQATSHDNVALLLLQQGRLEEAARHLQAALTLNPNFEEARRALQELSRRPRTGRGGSDSDAQLAGRARPGAPC